jgi:hypothetical protein
VGDLLNGMKDTGSYVVPGSAVGARYLASGNKPILTIYPVQKNGFGRRAATIYRQDGTNFAVGHGLTPTQL